MHFLVIATLGGVFGWATRRHLRAGRMSHGPARAFWTLLAAQSAVCGILMAGSGVMQGPRFLEPHPPTAFEVVGTTIALLLAASAMSILAFARTPPAHRSRMLDLLILLVGGTSLVQTLVAQLLENRPPIDSALLTYICAPFTGVELVALLWMLRLPGRRSRSLIFVLVGAALMTSPTVPNFFFMEFFTANPDLASGLGSTALAAFICWAIAASHPSAPSIADQAEGAPETFGSSRLLLFAAALLMLPANLLISAWLDKVSIVSVVLSSTALAALVVLRFRAMFHSVHESKVELAAQEALFRTVVESIHDMIVITNREGEIVYHSPAAVRAFGERGFSLADRIAPDEVERLGELLLQAADQPGSTFTSDLQVETATEGWRCYDLAVQNLNGVMGEDTVLWSLHDVTDRSRLETELRYQALHDALTGLPNRVLVADRIGTASSRARRSNSEVGVLFIDLDNFKNINDSLGHASGDELLCIVADRLRATVRDVDTVARLGGDEFAVIAEGINETAEMVILAERIRSALREPVDLTGGRVSVTASVGIALGNPTNAGDLLRNADVAMYEAKAAGKDFVVLFTEGMANAGTTRLHLEMDLIDAIEAGDQLVVHYQPIVALADQQIVGGEALVRWQHPTLGLVPPLQFVSIAEDIGLIGDIGRFVLHTACRHAASVQQENPGYTMSVNISARQLESGTLVDDVKTALLDSGLDPHLLILELTESTVVRRLPEATQQLTEIRTFGTRIAIDDFGTGFSTVSALRDLPIDILKIDRSFVSGMHQSPEGTNLVHALIEMGRSLNLWTVAEGVEEEGERDALIAEKCDAAQGYLFGRPVPEPAAPEVEAGTAV